MKITVILDEEGQVVGATPGPVGDASALADTGDEAGGGIELASGLVTREVEVPEAVFENGDEEELRRHLSG